MTINNLEMFEKKINEYKKILEQAKLEQARIQAKEEELNRQKQELIQKCRELGIDPSNLGQEYKKMLTQLNDYMLTLDTMFDKLNRLMKGEVVDDTTSTELENQVR